MDNKKKLILIIFIILILLIIGVIMILKPGEKKQYNEQLSTDQISSLLKISNYVLTKSETLSDYSITDESMIDFALGYMEIENKHNISYDYDNMIATTDLETIQRTVNHIFGRQLKYSNVSYNISNGNIQIPIKTFGGDAKVYKFKSKVYDNVTDSYIVYIDCLESGVSQINELLDDSVTQYDSEYVLATLIFKYKEIDGRKILLAFNVESNY